MLVAIPVRRWPLTGFPRQARPTRPPRSTVGLGPASRDYLTASSAFLVGWFVEECMICVMMMVGGWVLSGPGDAAFDGKVCSIIIFLTLTLTQANSE